MDDLTWPVPDGGPLLPVLTLVEAQDVMDVLGAVVTGGEMDAQLAGELLSNLAARVPSRS